MAYFDNAATTFPKPECVYEAMDQFYRSCGGSAGRGTHGIAKETSLVVAETRDLIKEVLRCPLKQVVFTSTATIALNMILQGLIAMGKRNFYISPFEHNAVTRVLHHFEEIENIRVYELHVTDCMEYDLERIKYQFDNVRPDVVVVSHVSNVIGLVAPIEDIFKLAKKYDAVTVGDMAQSAGLIDTNVGAEEWDFAVFAGHKTLYGPTGISGFVMNTKVELPPVLFGGTGYDSMNQSMPDTMPEKYEMGTMNTVGIAGLHASLMWLKDVSIERLYEREQENRRKLLELLREFDFIKVVGENPEKRYTGIVSCLIDGISSDSAANIFNQCEVAVRTGLHCAPKAHRFLKTMPAGTVRFSVSYFTSEKDFEELRETLEYIEENM